nr:double zinc ribbon domain-containing protein [Aestuariivita boseongensis]
MIFPPRCVGCGSLVDTDFQLCGSCWVQTPFITGLVCDGCGLPLHGSSDGQTVQCDDCMEMPRPWKAGRAALLYQDGARRMVLALKHGGRMEVARAAAGWLERAAGDLLRPDTLIAPIPLHWTRLFHRTFNQSAALAQALADKTGSQICPDLLIRPKRTLPLDRKSVAERFEALSDVMSVHPRRAGLIRGRPVLLVDDVMTSGATFTAAAQCCLQAGSGDVFVLALARVAKDA